MTFVESSSINSCINSVSLISALFPRLTILLKPIPSSIAQSNKAVPRAPLCDMNAMLPFLGSVGAKEAFNGVFVSIIPKQFGPRTRILCFLHTFITASSLFAPSIPLSLNPDERIIRILTFFSPIPSIILGTISAGTATTQRSMFPSTSRMFG